MYAAVQGRCYVATYTVVLVLDRWCVAMVTAMQVCVVLGWWCVVMVTVV